jgi:hypothetical protein
VKSRLTTLVHCDAQALPEMTLTARYAKKTSPYIDWMTIFGWSTNDGRGTTGREMYINADAEYKAADSMMISAAKRGPFDVPGIRETRRIRVTIMMVEAVVVPTDNAMEAIRRGLLICSGIQTGQINRAKYAMPAAENSVRSPRQILCTLADTPMEATFKASGTPTTFQLWLQTIQVRHTYTEQLAAR